MSVRSSHARSNSVCVRGWHEKGRVEAEHGADVENLMKRVDPMNRPRFWIKKTKDALNVNVHRTKLTSKRAERCPNHDMPQEQLKCFQTLGKRFFGLSENENRHSMVLRHGGTRTKNALKGTVNWQTKASSNKKSLHTPCMDDHQFGIGRAVNGGEKCQHVALKLSLKCLYSERIGRPDILWSVNKRARAVTKWTRACNRRLARLVSRIDKTSDFRQCWHVAHTAHRSRLGLSQDADFAGILKTRSR